MNWLETSYTFLLGFSAACALAIGLRFFHFYRRSADRLFLIFALAFWLMGLGWAMQVLVPRASESSYLVFLARLLAFSFIIYGIIDKNRAARRS